MASMSFHEDVIDNDILIEEIESRPLLYDKSLMDYSNMNFKTKAWEEVCEKVFSNIWGNPNMREKTEAVKVVQKRWKNIRACFSRELRDQKNVWKSGQAPKKRKMYRYYEKLLFLLPNMEMKDNTGNSTPDADKYDEDKYDEDKYDEDKHDENKYDENKYDEDKSDEVDEPSNTNKRKRDQKKGEKNKTFENRLLDILEEKRDSDIKLVADSNDSEKCFALSLVPLLKAVPEENRIDTRIKLLQVLNNSINHQTSHYAQPLQGTQFSRPNQTSTNSSGSSHQGGCGCRLFHTRECGCEFSKVHIKEELEN